jgi:hypothetical protein
MVDLAILGVDCGNVPGTRAGSVQAEAKFELPDAEPDAALPPPRM